MKTVIRKRRILKNERGCYFKYKQREIMLPKNMLVKKMLFSRLLTDVTKIPDFRKNMAKQQLHSKAEGDFDGDDKRDIHKVVFAKHKQ